MEVPTRSDGDEHREAPELLAPPETRPDGPAPSRHGPGRRRPPAALGPEEDRNHHRRRVVLTTAHSE